MFLSKRPGRRRVIAAATMISTALVVPQALSFEAIAVGTRRTLECFGLMLKDPPGHAQECLPYRGPSTVDEITTQGGPAAAPVVVAAPPPAPVVVDEPKNPGSGPADT